MGPSLQFLSLRLGLFWLLAVAAPEAGAVDRETLASLPLSSGQHQLFLDDFVLGDIYRVTRVIQQPTKYEHNPVIAADRPTDGTTIEIRSAPSWDEREKCWKIWYMTNGDAGGCGFARSTDGIRWEKPNLGLTERSGNRDNNLVMVKGDPKAFIQHVFMDSGAPAARRYKGMIGPGDRRPVISADGYTFTPLNVPSIPSQDESHLDWDPLASDYFMTVKHNGPFGRSVYLTLSKDFEVWSDPVLIYHADFLDQQLGEKHIRELEANPAMWRPTINEPREYNVEIYNMPVIAYEGMYVGFPTYFESSGRIPLPRGNQDGTNSVKLACSRDLRAWTRVGDRQHFLPVSELGKGGLDTGQLLTARPIRMGNELWFYYSGLDVRYRPKTERGVGEYHGAIHLAKLRLDGFVSLHADDEGGFLDTRPLRFDGNRLFVNAVAKGEIRAEVVERGGRTTLPGWGLDDCEPVAGDHLKAELRWKSRDLKELRGRNVVIRFHLKNADLYSFWIEKQP